MNIVETLINKAKEVQKTIVFPEAEFSERIINASKIISEKNIADVVLIGDENTIKNKLNSNKLNNITIINPKNYEKINEISNLIYEKRKSKGMTEQEAKDLSINPIYFANAYVEMGLADGIVCGAEVSTAKTLKPALQIIKSKNGLVSSYFIFAGENRVTDNVFLMGDCAVVENPSYEQEYLIAEMLLKESKFIGISDPRFAFLSYSTCGSAKSEDTEKVQKAYNLFAEKNPNVQAVGEVQFDASVLENVAKTKMPNKPFKAPANIFVMPNISAGNIGYKMVQYFANLQAIGPITMGFNKPVNDLSRGCSVEDIVLVTAITVLQA